MRVRYETMGADLGPLFYTITIKRVIWPSIATKSRNHRERFPFRVLVLVRERAIVADNMTELDYQAKTNYGQQLQLLYEVDLRSDLKRERYSFEISQTMYRFQATLI